MFQKKAPFVALLAVAAAVLGGCQGGGTGTGGGGTQPSRSDLSDTEPLPGVVRIVGVDRGADGRVTYRVANISGKLQEDLAYRVFFRYPPSAEGAIKKLSDWEPTPVRDLVLLKSDSAKEIVADNPQPGTQVIDTKLMIEDTPPVAVVARDGNRAGTGTLFLERALECVGLASEDELRAGTLWIDVENVSSRRVTELEARAVFVDRSGEKQAETRWTTMKDLEPGARGRVDFDVSGLGRVASFTFLIKIRQQSL